MAEQTTPFVLTVVITGGTGGIGLQTALGIAKLQTQQPAQCYRLILTGRNETRGQAAVQRVKDETGNKNFELAIGDVSSAAGVHALAKTILELTDDNCVEVLINNTGYLGDELKTSEDGLEMHFQVNVCSPWLLTVALLPALKKAHYPARVINVTGGEETPEPIDVDNLQAEKGFRGLLTYSHSKSVAEAMSMALSKELDGEISVNVVFPGRASTAMTGSLSLQSLPGPMKLLYPIFWLMFRDDGGKSAQKAATSSIWAATSPDLLLLDDGGGGDVHVVTGKYFDSTTKERTLHPTAYDAQVQAKIVALIEK